MNPRCLLAGLLVLGLGNSAPAQAFDPSTGSRHSAPSGSAWSEPGITRQCRPWAYWWWMGSAVDTTNLTRELKRYQAAAMGGVHIIPIYGAKGYEARYIDYLSPRWMQMLRFTVTEAHRLGLGVDMTTGTGWCFGGPNVSPADANALAVVRQFKVAAGARLSQKVDPQATQALVAFSPQGTCLELTNRIQPDGTVAWVAAGGPWQVYAVSQRPSGQQVKRAAPGGAGPMLNLLEPRAVKDYLRRFSRAFADYTGPRPRAMYHDSYEYRSDWAPSFFAEFQKRRGYRLQTQLPALFGKEQNDHVARVKCDYRETVSEIMAEESLPVWVEWAHREGFLTRNEAHGSPGNWLDLYADADIPETEMFHEDRNRLVAKFASSAAHVAGRRLTAAETGTWLKEHFTVKLADLKYLLDDMFLSGVDHVFYHGTCYSPDEAPWPGWVFYASTEMNPRNSIWHDVPALNHYVARCQSFLQAGKPDNDVLLYWPIFDFWHNPAGMLPQLTVSARSWFDEQSIGRAAGRLWEQGFAFDYMSDHWLHSLRAVNGHLVAPGGVYQTVVIPQCRYLPLKTLQTLLALADHGATVIFEDQLPQDVPGWGGLEVKRAEFHHQLGRIHLRVAHGSATQEAILGQGRILVGQLVPALERTGIAREPMVDHPGLFCLRRAFSGGRDYFIANRGQQPVIGWVPLAMAARTVVVFDPLRDVWGLGALKPGPGKQTRVRLQLPAGASLILRAFSDRKVSGPPWKVWRISGPSTPIRGKWQVRFVQGGPTLPASFQTRSLASWTVLGGKEAQRIAGTARYRISFDAPSAGSSHWRLDLGEVCQSARVRLNGRRLGTLLAPPFRLTLGPLKPRNNVLEIDVTNRSANRIRDLDRRGVKWQNFHNINFVNIHYRHFDASTWPVRDSGLLGPVTLTPVAASE